ncbi:MAG: hypothetical protein BMS9Abin26_0482 [Gammaproteobacteria bacterium]|nr:MAG: hypothetical protein BMS9Abin26_0482 [Gammaproteobacteria bacterium]
MTIISKYFNDAASFDRFIYIICAALVLTIFIIDLLLPLGVAGGVPYILVILVALWIKNPRAVIILAIICSLLTVLGFYLSPAGGELWKVMANRSLAIFAIWVTAILALKWKLDEKKVSSLEHKIEEEKERIYLATIHGAQHITNNLLNELQIVKTEIALHPEFSKEISSLFGDMLAEADTLMDDLSTVDQIDDEVIRQSIYPKEKTKRQSQMET